MDIYIKDIKEQDCLCDALILPFTEDSAEFYDSFLPASVSRHIKKYFSKEFHGKQDELLIIPSPDDILPERIFLMGIGKRKEISAEKVRRAGGKAAVFLKEVGMKKIALSSKLLVSLQVSSSVFVEGALLGIYTFKKYKREKDKRNINTFFVLSKGSKKLKEELQWTKIVTSSVCFTRDLINIPANDMTPRHLSHAAVSLKKKNLSVRVLTRKDAEKLGMFSYLSVAKGSKEPPQFIVLQYKGSQMRPLVVIGKSITFDSGGISLKPAQGMDKMKYDMAGGAAVLGIMKGVSESKLPVHVIGILPATENLIGESASRPGDIVTTMNGKTIEIISTDAEGRMTLADAISYAKRSKPKAIIDIATLTGACSIALGNEAIAMMGSNRKLLDKMKISGKQVQVYERVWEMPLFEEYE